MLNPPLSHLPDDLLVSIVEQLAKLPFADDDLNNLSLTDRAFTQSCQNYIFRNLVLGKGTNIFKQLIKVKRFLDDKPLLADRVRKVQLSISSEESEWLFMDPNFISILQLFAKSPMPPHELHFSGLMRTTIKHPRLVVRQFGESFFSQTLTVLRFREIGNVPLPLFLICPRLREVFLDRVGATDKSYDKYPDNQCSGREAPQLEVFNYCNSHSLVEQMIAPPPRFTTPVILWSNLRVLTLAPDDNGGMACLQPILDASCNTLEELYLTGIGMAMGGIRQLPLSEFVNLSNIPNLLAFSLYAVINFKTPRNAPPFGVLDDINIVLGTIPQSNRVTNLGFDFQIVVRKSQHSSLGCQNEDWIEMFNEVIRIGGGKPLELELQMGTTMGFLETNHDEQDEFYKCVMEKAASLSDYSNICTHFWTDWNRSISPSTRGQVRRRCKR